MFKSKTKTKTSSQDQDRKCQDQDQDRQIWPRDQDHGLEDYNTGYNTNIVLKISYY